MIIHTRRAPPATFRTGALSRSRAEQVVYVPPARLVLDPSVDSMFSAEPCERHCTVPSRDAMRRTRRNSGTENREGIREQGRCI